MTRRRRAAGEASGGAGVGQHLAPGKDGSNYSENGPNREEHYSLIEHIVHYSRFCRVGGVVEDFYLFAKLLPVA